jgi:hypothetical protein
LTVPARRLSRVETVAQHLLQRGHISEGSSLIEYGRFRLADVIHRLRNERTDLLPHGKEIVTIHRKDTQGNNYGEYHLVEKTAAATRRMVEAARARASTPAALYPNAVTLAFLEALARKGVEVPGGTDCLALRPGLVGTAR